MLKKLVKSLYQTIIYTISCIYIYIYIYVYIIYIRIMIVYLCVVIVVQLLNLHELGRRN
jgi:hypothetical protein